jgi:hypothetical protein
MMYQCQVVWVNNENNTVLSPGGHPLRLSQEELELVPRES